MMINTPADMKTFALCIIMLYNFCTINSTVFSTKGGLTYDSNKTSGFTSELKKIF